MSERRWKIWVCPPQGFEKGMWSSEETGPRPIRWFGVSPWQRIKRLYLERRGHSRYTATVLAMGGRLFPDFEVWNRTLTSREVETLYRADRSNRDGSAVSGASGKENWQRSGSDKSSFQGTKENGS